MRPALLPTALLAAAVLWPGGALAGEAWELGGEEDEVGSASGSAAGFVLELDCGSAAVPKSPKHDREAAGPDPGHADRAGYADVKFSKSLAVHWKEPAPSGKAAEPWFIKKVEAGFKLSRIAIYVSSNFPEAETAEPQPTDESCPYAHVLTHERAHAVAYRGIVAEFCRRLEKDIRALAAEGAIPTPEKPWSVTGGEAEAAKAKADGALVGAIQARRKEALDCMAKDKANKDSKESYCSLYKRCDAWTWRTALPEECKGVSRDAKEPPLPAECLPEAAPARGR